MGLKFDGGGAIEPPRGGSETLASVSTFSSTGMPAPGLNWHWAIASAVAPLGELPRTTVRTKVLNCWQ